MLTDRPVEEICYVCGDVITRFDQTAIVKMDNPDDTREKRAHTTCCPALYVRENDLMEETWQTHAKDVPRPNEEKRRLLKLENVDVVILQEDFHHIDIIINSEAEVMKDTPPDIPISIGLTHAIDRRGTRATVSFTYAFEEYLKKRGVFDGENAS